MLNLRSKLQSSRGILNRKIISLRKPLIQMCHPQVSQAEGQAQATTWSISFMETSAKTNHNVTELFQELLNMEKTRTVSLQLDTKKQKKQKKEKKSKDTNGSIPENGDAGASASGGAKEKCRVM